MPQPETNDPLDALLRENDGYIEDGGFTARVVKSLPRRRYAWVRAAVLLGVTAVGFALLLWWLPPLTDVVGVDRQGTIFVELNRHALVIGGMLALVGGSLVWSLYAVLRWEE